MVYLIWVVFMGILVGFLAVPIAQRFGYGYGRFGRLGDMVAVIVGAVVGAVILSALFGAIGVSLGGQGGGIVGGILGAIVSVGLLIAFSAKAAADDPNKPEDIA